MNMPEPNANPPEAVSNPKALFWYLTLFFSLDVMAVALGGLWFQFVNKWLGLNIPGSGIGGFFSQEAVKMEIASLLVAGPVFFLMSRLVRRALHRGALSPENRVRMWISYIILFLVVAVAVGDLIRTLFAVLSGDFTVRFLLKALAILIIAVYIFVYYRLELKAKDALTSSKLPKRLCWVAVAVIAASLLISFFVIESPRLTRQKAFDRTRVEDLSSIKSAVDSYYYEYGKLPASLEEMRATRWFNLIDNENGKPYEYKATGKDAYTLCAEFTLSSKDQGSVDYRYEPYQEFVHDAGRVCFDRVVSAQPEGMKKMPVSP
jgi:hypothetical protein